MIPLNRATTTNKPFPVKLYLLNCNGHHPQLYHLLHFESSIGTCRRWGGTAGAVGLVVVAVAAVERPGLTTRNVELNVGLVKNSINSSVYFQHPKRSQTDRPSQMQSIPEWDPSNRIIVPLVAFVVVVLILYAPFLLAPTTSGHC